MGSYVSFDPYDDICVHFCWSGVELLDYKLYMCVV